MKLINKSIYVLSLAGMLGLWACTADEEMSGMENSGKQIPVTITVSRTAMPDTRTVLTEDGNGNLTDVWSETDQLALVDATGEQVGTLKFQEYVSEDNQSTAVFEGTMTATGEGTKPYRIWYLGAGESPYSEFTHERKVDGQYPNLVKTILSKQSGKLEDLVKGDLMHAAVKLNIQEGRAVVEESVTMTKLFAMARFSLKEAAGVTNGKLTITSSSASGSNKLYHKWYYLGVSGELQASVASASEFITIENVDTSNDVYVVLPTVKDFHLTFTLTSGNDIWTYTTAGTNTLAAGKYYCNADGTGIGIALKNDKEEEVVDHSKNPLLKWAETNLVYDETTASSKFAASSSVGGSLYQWGRNHGFEDYNDAMGGYNNQGVYNYGVYNKESDACGGWFNANQKWEYSSRKYDSSSKVRANTTMFMMSFYGEDYWDSSFGDGGSNWDERAEKCNYSNAICPEGWRMPTQADFMEIWPKTGINTTGNLATAIANLGTEVREIEDVCKYIINWRLSNNVLIVSCLVVPDSFEKSMVTDDTWDDENVVTRSFGTTGAIEAYQHTHTFYHSPNTNMWPAQIVNMDIARPMPFGTWNAEPYAIDSYNLYTGIWSESWYTIGYSSIQDAGALYEGAYWVSDINMIFRFRNNNGSSFGPANTTSIFGASYQPRHNAFAIRCVKK